MYHKEVALKIEHFHNDEDIAFRIPSKVEMLSILQSLADQGTHAALYYGRGQNFILTTLLGANEHGMWLDVGPFPLENKNLLLSDKFTFVSVHRHAKIQFMAHDIQNDLFKNNEAFYMALPDYLLRIQRREFFRTTIPAGPPIKCIIPVSPENPDDQIIMREVPIVDICGGGIGLLREENEAELLPRKTFPDCQISIPDVGTLTGTIEVRYNIDFTTPNNVIHKRVGCRFIHQNNQMENLLQSYITRLQSESLARQ
jgi:c-di-GMP-binding flagellar brake protein YcgR